MGKYLNEIKQKLVIEMHEQDAHCSLLGNDSTANVLTFLSG